MKIEIKTSSYNPKRYSKPWIARIDFAKNPRGDYQWGAWVGDDGAEGILVIEAGEGDIISSGQKDHRNPKYTEKNYFVVENGQLKRLGGMAEAYAIFTKKSDILIN